MARRIRVYLFGVILGVIVVYSSLIKDRGKELLGWLPGPRVLGELNEYPQQISDKANCQLKCYVLGESILEEVYMNGDVKFSESRPKEDPRYYKVELEKNKQIIQVELTCKDSLTTIASVIILGEEGKCDCQ